MKIRVEVELDDETKFKLAQEEIDFKVYKTVIELDTMLVSILNEMRYKIVCYIDNEKRKVI